MPQVAQGRRAFPFLKVPWSGGINASVDPGVLPDDDLIVADNVVFSSTTTRLKREGHDAFDSTSELPVPSTRASSGTTKTIVFASALQPTSPDRHKLVLGERITVTSDAAAESTYETTAEVTSLTGSTITYEGSGSATESTTAVSSTFTIKRRPYIHGRDFWYTNASGVKLRYAVAVTDQGKIFRHDTDGNRIEITPNSKTFTTVDTGTERATITGHGWSTGQLVYLTTTGSLPGGLSVNTAYYIIRIDADTVQFATSKANALASTAINLTSSGSGTHTARIRRLDQPMGATALTRVNSVVFNNKLIIGFSGVGNYPIIFDPLVSTTEYYELAINSPDCDMLVEHLGRIFTNDKLELDFVHWCSTFDHTLWLGLGDSGGDFVSPGDGDPSGITCIFPSFKQTLFIGKKTKTYKVVGYTPEEFQFLPVSTGLGTEGSAVAAAIDLDDVIYISQRGVHSIKATDAYGDFDGAYLSQKIKPTFASWPKTQLAKINTVYIPDLSSVCFNIAEETSTQSAIWLFNVEKKEWYRWPNLSARAMWAYLDGDNKTRLMYSNGDGNLRLAQNGVFTDPGNVAIRYRIKTGQIYPDENPQTWKHFKKLSLLYKPRGRYSFTLKVWIDNLPIQTYSFSQGIEGDELGTAFILGQSVLGASSVFAPFTVDIEGHGRGIQFEVENDNRDEQVEIYGYSIEFEGADYNNETET